ncbi:hypothetical protein A0H81_03124 [Grifola frondosa]|uniref:F-box domain-containing protein n=1 Tax=Grifola frondosa TaxID=5627 RepID=A0A1C7MHW6_GRIFR|nr:hypothetical protein A0H81_03124 [Grifola frondosa]
MWLTQSVWQYVAKRVIEPQFLCLQEQHPPSFGCHPSCAPPISCYHPLGTMSNLVSLNDNVLFMIVSYLSHRDALSLSLTTREIYPLVIMQVPATVTCRSPLEMTEAHSYMILSHIPNHARRLTHLDVSLTHTFHDPGEIAPLLADLLENAVNLKHITVGPFASLLSHEPRVGVALNALTKLENIYFHGDPSDDSLTILTHSRSKPRLLSIAVGQDEGYRRFFSSLTSFSQSLVKLKLTDLIRLPAGSPDRLANDVDLPVLPLVQLPQVQYLSLAQCRYIIPWVALAHALPNVHSLLLDRVAKYNTLPRQLWPKLRRLVLPGYAASMDIEELCPVHWLIMGYPFEHGSSEPESDHMDIVHTASPTMLSVNASKVQACLKLIHEAGPRLKFLHVDVGYIHSVRWPGDEVSDPILPPPVLCFRARLSEYFKERINAGRTSFNTEVETMLSSAYPPPHYFAISIQEDGHPDPDVWSDFDEAQWTEYRWWKITGDGLNRQATEIPQWKGERIRRYLFEADSQSIQNLDWDNIDELCL